ncbi:GNAT family N-acetyltransferase [Arenimonas soli]|nr:GNAT family N-acetyltransferase [Arenimonas soli]
MQLSLRAATDADLPFLLALRRESMGPHLATAGLHGTDEDFMVRVMHRFDCAEIIMAEGRPVGLLKLLREPDQWHVLQLQLSADTRGRGLGRRLLEDVMAQAAKADVPVTLSVLKANPAKQLYERLGFSVVGEDAHEFRMTHLAPGRQP